MFVKNVFFVSLLILVACVLIGLYQENSSAERSKRIIKWSEENQIEIKSKAEVFKVVYDQNETELLLEKLKLSRYFEPLNSKDVPRWDFGFDPEYAKELVDYWINKFDWKKQVEYLNKFSQFRIKVNDDITIHYVRHVTNPQLKTQVPLLLLDGWPGSFFGFYKMIDYINDNYKDVSFDIVVPSIPGYAYSTPLYKPVDVIDTSQYFDSLMRHIYGNSVKYHVHGEDWGAIIATSMAQMYPKRVASIHITMPAGVSPTDPLYIFYQIAGSIYPSILYSPEELKLNLDVKSSFKNIFLGIIKQSGYFHLQATKPDTVGFALTDSPVGLMAYVLEKYSTWSFDFDTKIVGKKDGGLDKFNKDDLLTVMCLYWHTKSITSAMRYYKNLFRKMGSEDVIRNEVSDSKIPDVPVAVQLFVNEIFLTPSKLVQLKYKNLKKYSLVDDGGHFGAFENPVLTGKDLIEFVKSCL